MINVNNLSRKKLTQIYIFFNDFDSFDENIHLEEHGSTESFHPFIYPFIYFCNKPLIH